MLLRRDYQVNRLKTRALVEESECHQLLAKPIHLPVSLLRLSNNLQIPNPRRKLLNLNQYSSSKNLPQKPLKLLVDQSGHSLYPQALKSSLSSNYQRWFQSKWLSNPLLLNLWVRLRSPHKINNQPHLERKRTKNQSERSNSVKISSKMVKETQIRCCKVWLLATSLAKISTMQHFSRFPMICCTIWDNKPRNLMVIMNYWQSRSFPCSNNRSITLEGCQLRSNSKGSSLILLDSQLLRKPNDLNLQTTLSPLLNTSHPCKPQCSTPLRKTTNSTKWSPSK